MGRGNLGREPPLVVLGAVPALLDPIEDRLVEDMEDPDVG
jgi:hypothetical protein